MLQKMRDNTQSLGFKILVGAIIFVLAIFGFGAFNLFLNPDPEIASVNGDEITQSELQAETERARVRLLNQLGEGADPAAIDTLQLQGQVLDQLINRRLMQQAADQLSLATSKKRADKQIIENPGFQVEGRFDEELYLRVLRQFGYTPAAFSALARQDMAVEQLQSGITESAVVPTWQLRWLVELMQQKRDLAYLALTPEYFAERAEVTEEELNQHYDDNRLAYQTEETVDLQFVELSWEDLLEQAKQDVTEEDLLSRYEADKAAALADEQRRSSHILLRLTDDRDEAAAVAEARQLIAQINTGADFAALAEEHSDDPGSAANGGDLGPAGKGVFVPEFEEALFALEVGALSEPVVSQFGVHIIRLDEVIQPSYPSFEEQRPQLEVAAAEAGARSVFTERLNEMDQLAFEQNTGLDGIAQAFSLEIKRVKGVTRSEGAGLFANQELRDAAFSEDVLDRAFNSAAIEYTDQHAVVLRLDERHPPREQTFAEVRDAIEADIRAEKAAAAIDQTVTDGLAQLEAGAPVSEIANAVGLSWETKTLASNTEPGVPREVLEAAFDLPQPVQGKQVAAATLADGGRALVTVTRVQNGDIETMTEQQVDGLARFLQNRTGNLDFSSLFESMRDQASIQRPEAG